MTTKTHIAIVTDKLHPQTYAGDKYGEYEWRKLHGELDGYAHWYFETEAQRDAFVKDHSHLDAKNAGCVSTAPPGAAYFYGMPCGSDGYQDYPLDPDCDLRYGVIFADDIMAIFEDGSIEWVR